MEIPIAIAEWSKMTKIKKNIHEATCASLGDFFLGSAETKLSQHCHKFLRKFCLLAI